MAKSRTYIFERYKDLATYFQKHASKEEVAERKDEKEAEKKDDDTLPWQHVAGSPQSQSSVTGESKTSRIQVYYLGNTLHFQYCDLRSTCG